MLQTNTGTENLKKCESNCTIRVTGASNAARNLPLASSGSRPTAISFRSVHGRGARRHPLCQDPWHQASALAHGIVGAASDEGRRHRACQQDRADGLGYDGQKRALQRTRRTCGVNEIAPDTRRDVKVGKGEQHVMQSRSIRRSGQPTCAIALSNARVWTGPDPRRALCQRSCEPHKKAEHMAAPTNAANVKKARANSEPSTHGTKRTSRPGLTMSVPRGRSEVIGAR